MRQHHPLGRPRGPRGINNGSQIVGLNGATRSVRLRMVFRRALLHQIGHERHPRPINRVHDNNFFHHRLILNAENFL